MKQTQPLQTRIVIPYLAIPVIKHKLGPIFHIIASGGEKEISGIEDIQISPRRKAKLYKLSEGSKYLVTSYKNIRSIPEADGVLFLKDSENPNWLSHKLLNEFNEEADEKGFKFITEKIADTWKGNFIFKAEERDSEGKTINKGLRGPQIGALHSIGAHWSINQAPATIVMPTGTGKTETMLAAIVAYNLRKVLIVVPSQVLRDQTASKFIKLGLLREFGSLNFSVRNPIVGIIRRRPRTIADLDIIDKCNVIVSTMSAIAEGSAVPLIPEIASRIDTLIVDEAHHIAAKGWTYFREHFTDARILQFTATPYRQDGKLVDGKVIYNYPLNVAQKEKYFKKISFEPVYEIDKQAGDRAIAVAAVNKLREDLDAGHDHLLMARCHSIKRAEVISEIYKEIAPDFKPLIIHSESGNTSGLLSQINSRKSRIVVCVNMLGEGFDLPQLKIAAVHDTHKSLAVLLQFVGRFTRSNIENVGDATVIANIAEQEVSSALERLYSEDADWNHLLSEFSSEASRGHAELMDFLNSSERLDEPGEEETFEISHHLLRPKFSTLVYKADSFQPKNFFRGLPAEMKVHRVWLHKASNTLYFVTRFEPPILWSRSRELKDRQWDLFILHYNPAQKLLYLDSSDKSSLFEKLAQSVGGDNVIYGDIVFRTLGGINRLVFQNVGVRKHGRRNLRYALYTGSDVAEALSISERAGSVKSNLSGIGWDNGRPVTIGCSYKGRVWSRETGTIPEFVRWSATIGAKLLDEDIDTTKIIENVLIPEEITKLPEKEVLCVDWPLEILRQSEERVVFVRGENDELPITLANIEFVKAEFATNQLEFRIRSAEEENWCSLTLQISETEGYKVISSSEHPVSVHCGSLNVPIGDFFSSYPPLVRFIDLSELDGNLLIKPQNPQELVLPEERIEVWDWTGVDIRKESIWKEGTERKDSIQWKAACKFIEGGFDIVFNDDDAGEAADLVCLKEEKDYIRLALIHCKFTSLKNPGERVKDVVEVSSQAVRSAKWKWKFKDLCRHLLLREKKMHESAGRSRFLKGNSSELNKFMKLYRFKEIRPEILIVQPGLSQINRTSDQTAVLAAACSYLKETIGVDLDIICSK